MECESWELLCSNYKIERTKKLRFSFFFPPAGGLKVPVTEAGSKIMSWRKKTNDIKKKKVWRNCRVFRGVSCLMRTILPGWHCPRLPDITPLWRYRVGSRPMSWATKDPSSSLTRGVVSFHSRLTTRPHVHVTGRGKAEHTRAEGEEREAVKFQEMQPGLKPRECELST